MFQKSIDARAHTQSASQPGWWRIYGWF